MHFWQKVPGVNGLKKMLEKLRQFLSSEQPCELKSLDFALKITGVEKMPLQNLLLQST